MVGKCVRHCRIWGVLATVVLQTRGSQGSRIEGASEGERNEVRVGVGGGRRLTWKLPWLPEGHKRHLQRVEQSGASGAFKKMHINRKDEAML